MTDRTKLVHKKNPKYTILEMNNYIKSIRSDEIFCLLFCTFIIANILQIGPILISFISFLFVLILIYFSDFSKHRLYENFVKKNAILSLFFVYALFSIFALSTTPFFNFEKFSLYRSNTVALASSGQSLLIIHGLMTTKFSPSTFNFRVIGAFAIAICLLALFVLFSITFTDLGNPINRDNRFRLHFTPLGRANPNHLAACALIAIAACCIIRDRHPKLAILAIASAAFLVGLSNSYAAMISAVLGSAALWPKRRSLALVLLSCSIAGYAGAWLLSNVASLKSASTYRRLDIYFEFIKLWQIKPIWGHGFASEVEVNFSNIRHTIAHSVPLHTLVQGGLVGFTLFGLVAINALKNSVLLYRKDSIEPLLIFCMMVPIALFQKGPLFWIPNTMWLVAWVPVFAVFAYSPRQSDELNEAM